MNDIVPRKFAAKLSIGTSLFGIGTLKRVGRRERRRVAAGGVRNLEDLNRLEPREIDARDARGVVAIDEQPSPIGDTVGLRQLGVMGVVPRNETARGLEHRLRLFVVPPSILGVL